MKTYFIFFLGLLMLAITYNSSSAQNNDPKVMLCDNYDSLYSAVKTGIPAYIYKTAYINDFSLVEKSMITVYPKTAERNGYLVEMSILSLTKEENWNNYENHSILGFIVAGCKTVKSQFSKFNNTSCSFVALNPEDALEAAQNGISFIIDNTYLIEGTTVDVFKKMCVTNDPGHTVVKKPAVYLYPSKQMNVFVQVIVNGHLTFTDPDYNTGWNVNVTPSGLIDNKYDYLFYEADLNKMELPNEGWIVEYENLKTWFDEYLPKLGLNEKEKEQFEEYWLGKLRIANYYDIRILDNKFLSENMDLIINPKPETLLRLNFYFQPLSVKTELTAPEIKEVTRKGFTVVEWGGINGGDLKITP
jgi:hypothetical protein